MPACAAGGPTRILIFQLISTIAFKVSHALEFECQLQESL
jgi:hypothetical protein